MSNRLQFSRWGWDCVSNLNRANLFLRLKIFFILIFIVFSLLSRQCNAMLYVLYNALHAPNIIFRVCVFLSFVFLNEEEKTKSPYPIRQTLQKSKNDGRRRRRQQKKAKSKQCKKIRTYTKCNVLRK